MSGKLPRATKKISMRLTLHDAGKFFCTVKGPGLTRHMTRIEAENFVVLVTPLAFKDPETMRMREMIREHLLATAPKPLAA